MGAVTADKVIVELEARLGAYNASVKASEANFTRSMAATVRSMQQTERQIKASSDGIKTALVSSAGAIAGAFSVAAVKNFADAYTRYTNQLKVAGLEGAGLASTQERLFGIAQKYGVELESLGTLYARSSSAAKDLGASQEELFRFTEGVSAALKVQGGDASQAAGALLQLSQALGGGIVRAEEFNSVMEGARPIAQAVADGIDRFGGSVSKLRTAIADGKVTSQEFFQGFLRGSKDLEAQAEKANLTIAASFQVLNNALGKYIGEADAGLSATQKLAQAVAFLAENLDVIIPALATIATILVTRYAVGAVAATAATVAQTVAMSGAAGAARIMGASLLTAFGGPVGLAITAVSLAIGVFAFESAKAQAATLALNNRISAAHDALERQRKAAGLAATQTGVLTREQMKAATAAAALTGEVYKLEQAHYRAAAAAKAHALEEARRGVVSANNDYRDAEKNRSAEERRAARQMRGPMGPGDRAGLGGAAFAGLDTNAVLARGAADTANASEAGLRARQAKAVQDAAWREWQALMKEPLAKFLPTKPSAPDEKTKKDRKSTGPTPEELAAKREDLRLEQEMAVARAANDATRIRALESEMFIRQRTKEYTDAGLDAEEAANKALRDRMVLNEAEIAQQNRLNEAKGIDVGASPDIGPGSGPAAEDLAGQQAALTKMYANAFEGGLWAAIRGGGEGVAEYFASQLTQALVQDLSRQLGQMLAAYQASTNGGGNSFWGGIINAGISAFTGSSAVGTNAGGTSNWRGGLSWVGEKGPELVNLPKGAQVMPASQSAAMARSWGGSGQVLNFDLRGAVMTEDLLQQMQVMSRAAAQAGSIGGGARGAAAAASASTRKQTMRIPR